MVNRLFLVLVALLTSTYFFGQNIQQNKSVSVNFNDLYIGKNVSFEYGFYIDSMKLNMIILGIKLHDNRPILDNQYYLFKDRFRTDAFIEHFGIDLGYRRLFNVRSLLVKPFLFSRTDISYISMKNVSRRSLEPSPDNTPVYEESSFSTPPWFTFETRIGAGLLIPICKNFYLQQEFGCGIGYFIPTDEKNSVVIVTENYWEFINSWSIGVAYSF